MKKKEKCEYIHSYYFGNFLVKKMVKLEGRDICNERKDEHWTLTVITTIYITPLLHIMDL